MTAPPPGRDDAPPAEDGASAKGFQADWRSKAHDSARLAAGDVTANATDARALAGWLLRLAAHETGTVLVGDALVDVIDDLGERAA